MSNPETMNHNEVYDLIIDVNSLSNITKGWPLNMTAEGMKRYEEKSQKKSVVVSVVGNKNKGKSFLLTKLANIVLPSGYSVTTRGLSVRYPTFDEQNIVLLDTAGTETPITQSKEVYDLEKEMSNIEKDEKYKELKESIKDLDQETQKKKLDEFKNEKQRELLSKFTTDKTITEYFLQKFILKESNILIFLVEQLTYTDQKLLNRIRKECQGKKLFVVHNLYTLDTKENVENYIENVLSKSLTFKLKKIRITEFDSNKKEKNEKDVNQFYYAEEHTRRHTDDDDYEEEDKREIIHYIMARDQTEAGDYYNDMTIRQLRNQIKAFSNTDVFPIRDKLIRFFLKTSGDLIDGMRIKKEEVEIDGNLIKLKSKDDDKPKEIKLKKCLIDELGFSKFQGSLFTPCYKYYINKDKTRFIIEIEMPGKVADSHFQLKVDKNGNYLFYFTGRKELKIPEHSALTLNSIDKGKFEIVIRVPMSDIKLKDTTIAFKKRENGIQRVEFELIPPTPIEEDEYEEEKKEEVPSSKNNDEKEEEEKKEEAPSSKNNDEKEE